MFFFYPKSEEKRIQIAFRSEADQDMEGFNKFEYSPSTQEMALIQQNCALYLDNGIFSIEKTERIKQEEAAALTLERKKIADQKAATLQAKLDNGLTVTVKEVLELTLLQK